MMEELFEKAKVYKYTSLQYLDLEEIQIKTNEDIIIDKPGVFILGKLVDHCCNIYWAAESQEKFVIAMSELMNKINDLNVDGLTRVYIEFLQPDFILAMESLGFNVVSEFMDFWNEDLSINTIKGKESTSVSIRRIDPDEYVKVSLITKACLDLSRGFLADEPKFIREWDESEHSCILVADLNKSIVGVCFLNMYGFESEKGPVLWIRELAVDPKYQNNGIGHSLVFESVCWGKNNGAKRSFLLVDRENTKAIKIYNEFGYKCTVEAGQINMALVL